MLKYKEVQVTFEEVPSEVSLCINITGCPIKCEGCHSKHLWEDIGEELNIDSLTTLINKNEGVTCIAFMGGDAHPEEIFELAKCIKETTSLKVCWYSGSSLYKDLNKYIKYFDYIKTGPYKEELGGLDSITTNQRFYEVKCRIIKSIEGNPIDSYYYLDDITYKFQK